MGIRKRNYGFSLYFGWSKNCYFSFSFLTPSYPISSKQVFKRTSSNINIDIKKQRLLLKRLLLILIAIAISYFGLEWSYTALSIKLYHEVGKSEILYGIVFGGITAFLDAAIRPAAGKVNEKLVA